MTQPLLYRGKPLDGYSKKELIKIVEHLYQLAVQSNKPVTGLKVDTRAAKICHKCRKPVCKDHKWMYVTTKKGSYIVHRHCDNPSSYVHNGINMYPK